MVLKPLFLQSEDSEHPRGQESPVPVAIRRQPRDESGVTPMPDRGIAGRTTDADLVHRARCGEPWAQEAMYRRYVGLVGDVAGRLLRNRHDVEDVVSETFIIAFEQIDRLNEPAALRGWLVRIAVSRVHRRFRWWKFSRLVGGGSEVSPSYEEQASSDASPSDRAELALIDRALARLPVSQRVPWVLRHVVGSALEEIAVACECSLATVKRRISAADAAVALHLAGSS